MLDFNFVLNAKPYIHLSSILNVLSLGAIYMDELEFLVYGKDAEKAIATIKEFINSDLDYDNEQK
jgi:phosphotransferase system HPr-like phosphotransfer protein